MEEGESRREGKGRADTARENREQRQLSRQRRRVRNHALGSRDARARDERASGDAEWRARPRLLHSINPPLQRDFSGLRYPDRMGLEKDSHTVDMPALTRLASDALGDVTDATPSSIGGSG